MVEIVWLASVGVGLKVCLDGLDMWCSFVCLFLSSKGVLGCMRGRGQSREGNGDSRLRKNGLPSRSTRGCGGGGLVGWRRGMGKSRDNGESRGVVDEGDDG